MKVLDHIQPQESYMWTVSVLGPNLIDPSGKNGSELELYAMNTIVPSKTQEAISRRYNGIEYSYAGRETSPKIIRITFWDNDELDTYHFIQRWYDLCQDQILYRGAPPEEYKREIILKLKTRDDEFETERFTLKKAFPTEIAEANLTYDSSEPIQFDAMFHFSERRSGGGNPNV